MIVAISGTHGAGKTTLIEALLKQHPTWQGLAEITRSLMPAIGYDSPYGIVAENGIAMYEAAILGQWSTLPSHISRQSAVTFVCLLDRSPVDNLAYYFVHRDPSEVVHEKFLTKLACAYLPFIDLHIHVPCLPFGVPLDAVQRIDTQVELENIIIKLYHRLNVRYQTLTSISLHDRCPDATLIIRNY